MLISSSNCLKFKSILPGGPPQEVLREHLQHLPVNGRQRPGPPQRAGGGCCSGAVSLTRRCLPRNTKPQTLARAGGGGKIPHFLHWTPLERQLVIQLARSLGVRSSHTPIRTLCPLKTRLLRFCRVLGACWCVARGRGVMQENFCSRSVQKQDLPNRRLPDTCQYPRLLKWASACLVRPRYASCGGTREEHGPPRNRCSGLLAEAGGFGGPPGVRSVQAVEGAAVFPQPLPLCAADEIVSGVYVQEAKVAQAFTSSRALPLGELLFASSALSGR